MNAPIQGTASDIMKKAMVNISKKIENYDDTKILLQIHDEIVVESSDVSVQKIKEIVEIEMKNAARLKVPLFVNTKVATTLANFNNQFVKNTDMLFLFTQYYEWTNKNK